MAARILLFFEGKTTKTQIKSIDLTIKHKDFGLFNISSSARYNAYAWLLYTRMPRARSYYHFVTILENETLGLPFRFQIDSLKYKSPNGVKNMKHLFTAMLDSDVIDEIEYRLTERRMFQNLHHTMRRGAFRPKAKATIGVSPKSHLNTIGLVHNAEIEYEARAADANTALTGLYNKIGWS